MSYIPLNEFLQKNPNYQKANPRTPKDFSEWHGVKTHIQEDIYEERFPDYCEIWWAHLGLNVGFEQDGKGFKFKRPVLIIRRLTKELFLTLPLTTKNKQNYFYVPCPAEDGFFRMAILSQARVLDIHRLVERITKIERAELQKIKQAIRRKIL